MKKFLGVALVLWGVLGMSPAVGRADAITHKKVEHQWRRWHAPPKGELAVPELDPGAAAQALALVAGAAALMLERSRRRDAGVLPKSG